MNTSYAMSAYAAHDLNIAMRTSSGDEIKMAFSNHEASSLQYTEDEKGSSTSILYSSMQSFSYSIKTNGIDAQDQKEIDAYMKIAQPYIDDFLKELEEVAPKSPVSKLAKTIASIFEPSKMRDENTKNHIKTNIVKMFDNSIEKLNEPQKLNTQEMVAKIFKDAQVLLEKTLKEFDKTTQEIYA